jgi:prolipoprotein diacylglyceryltransferase
MTVFSTILQDPWWVAVTAGVLLTITIATAEAFRRQIPAAPWFATIGVTAVGVVIGARLGTLTPGVWEVGGRTVLGVLAGGFLSFFVASRLLRFPAGSLDLLAVATPVGMAAGRIGCIIAQCCRGRPTGLSWGVPAPEGTLHAGLHLHPVQAVEGILVALLALALHRFSRKAPRPGLLFGLFLAGYGLIRFATEFLRHRPEPLALGLSGPQVASGVVALLALMWLYRAGWPRSTNDPIPQSGWKAPSPPHDSGAPAHPLILPALVTFPLLVAVIGAGVLPVWERVLLLSATLPGLWALLATNPPRVALMRAVPVALIPFAIGPAPGADSIGHGLPSDTVPAPWTTVQAGAMSGKYQLTSCETADDFDYRMLGLGLVHYRPSSKGMTWKFRLAGFTGERRHRSGREGSTSSDPSLTNPQSTRGVMFGLGGDTRHFGWEVGMDPRPLNTDPREDQSPIYGGVRIGWLDRAWIELGHMDDTPFVAPNHRVRVGIGLASTEVPFSARFGTNGEAPYIALRLGDHSRAGIDVSLGPPSNEHHHLGVTGFWRPRW